MKPTIIPALLCAAGLLLIVGTGCSDDPKQAKDTVDADIDADTDADPGDTVETLPPSSLYLFKATTQDDLIGGPMPYGQVDGAWIIGNDQVRFMIQDVGVSAIYNLFGGNPIGADLVRADGEPDESILRETFSIIDWRVFAPTSVAVVDDGINNDRVILRFEGTLMESGIIDLLDTLAGDAPIEVAVEYEVRAGERQLWTRTILTNPTNMRVDVMVGDFVVFGKQLEIFTPANGFDTDSVGFVDWLASRGEAVSYGMTYGGKPLNVPLISNSGTVALLESGFSVLGGQTEVIERPLIVGDGSISSLIDPILTAGAADGAGSAVLSGQVTDAQGPVAGVWVSAVRTEDGKVVNQAQTGDDGRYSFVLAAGTHTLVASRGERRPSEAFEVTVEDGQDAEVDLTVEALVTVTVAVTGAGPRPTGDGTFPVKVSLRPLDGDPANNPRFGEEVIRSRGWRIEMLGADKSSFEAAPGSYQVIVSHGPEFDRVEINPFVVGADGPAPTLEATLSRVLETDGWLGCDFHQHTIGSLDSKTPLDFRVRENLAAGLECFATTEHDNVVNLAPMIASMGAKPALWTMIGDEVSVNGVGHFQAYPMPVDPADPLALAGVKLWAGLTIDALFAKLRALPGELTLQVNHPRDDGLAGYFAGLRVDPWNAEATRGTRAEDFDAIEVNGSLGSSENFTVEGWTALRSAASSDVPVLADWFGLLNAGRTVAAVGNSDCHDPGSDCAYPRTYLPVGDDPGTLTETAVNTAISAQRAIISQGLWLTLTTQEDGEAEGRLRIGHTQLVDGSAGFSTQVTVSAPPWLGVQRIELYRNGLFVEQRAAVAPQADALTWIDETFTDTPAIDSWYVFVVRGTGDGHPVFGGTPFAYTNPIYVDVDGNGFTAPGPVPLE
jgi:hypothetical protein